MRPIGYTDVLAPGIAAARTRMVKKQVHSATYLLSRAGGIMLADMAGTGNPRAIFANLRSVTLFHSDTV